MSRYSKFKERQKSASPYATQALCSKCKYCECVRAKGFCIGFGKCTKLPNKVFYSTKEGYCTQYYPKESKTNCEVDMREADNDN